MIYRLAQGRAGVNDIQVDVGKGGVMIYRLT